jgi:hypothetical protein
MSKSTGTYSGETVAVTIGVLTLVAILLLGCVMLLQNLSGLNPEGQEVPAAIAAGEK